MINYFDIWFLNLKIFLNAIINLFVEKYELNI